MQYRETLLGLFKYHFLSLQLDWLLLDNMPVVPLAGLRRVLANGSLELLPFPAERYRHDVHSTTYRCRLRLSSGFAVLSRSIHVHAGKERLFKRAI